MKNQDVSEIKKIFKKVNGLLKETGLIIVTFAKLNLPETLNIGYEKVKIRPYVPYPLRCRKCLRYGHPSNNCTNKQICPHCALDYHFEEDDEVCENPATCINCIYNNVENNKHSALDKICPIFLREKEIQTIVSLEKMDRKKATETYKQRHLNGQPSYATVTKTQSADKPNYSTNNNINSDCPNTSSRNQVNYEDIETHACNSNGPNPLSPKTKTIKLLPRNISNRAKQVLKRKNTKTNISKQKLSKCKINQNNDDNETSETMSFDE